MNASTQSVTLAGVHFTAAAASLPAPGKDQDAFLVTEGFAGLADGATPLRAGGEDPGAFAARVLDSLANARRRSTPRAVERAIGDAGGPAADDAYAPSCTFACIRELADDRLVVDVLGDCVAVVVMTDGSKRVIEDRRLEIVEAPITSALADHLANGRSYDEARAEVVPALTEARARRNTPGSYGVFTRDPVVASLVVSESVFAREVDRVLLVTDGFARLVRTYRTRPSFEALEEAVREGGLQPLLSEVRALDEDRSLVTSHPRLSLIDDATAIHLRRD